MTQKENILKALENGELITPLDALGRFGCFQLPARIFELKRDGHPIKTKIIKGNNNKHWAGYYIEKGGEHGQR